MLKSRQDSLKIHVKEFNIWENSFSGCHVYLNEFFFPGEPLKLNFKTRCER